MLIRANKGGHRDAPRSASNRSHYDIPRAHTRCALLIATALIGASVSMCPQAAIALNSSDLTVTLAGGESPAGTMNFTVTIANQGPDPASGIITTMPIPTALAYVSDDCGGSGATPWTWNVANLANGNQAVCQIVTSVVSARGFVAKASIQGSPDPNTANNVAYLADAVTGTAFDTPATGIALFRSFYDLAFKDETGAAFSLRDNADKVILLQMCTVWCGACNGWTKMSPALKQSVDQKIGSSGHFLDVDLLVQGSTGAPSSQANALAWKTKYNFPGPVLHSESSTSSPLFELDLDRQGQFSSVAAAGAYPEFFILAPACDNQIVVRMTPEANPPLAEQRTVNTANIFEMAALIADIWKQRPCAKPLVHRLDRCKVGYAPIYSRPDGGHSEDQESAVAFTVANGTKYDISSVTAVTDTATNMDFTVYADASGQPGSVVCSSLQRPTTNVYAADVRKIQLDPFCTLPAGNYWMSLRGHSDYDPGVAPNWIGGFLSPGGSYEYQNPSNSTGYNCTSWTPAGLCISGQDTTEPCYMLERDSVFDNGFETAP